MLLGLNFKGSVETLADLPSTGSDGDILVVEKSLISTDPKMYEYNVIVMWTGDSWHQLNATRCQSALTDITVCHPNGYKGVLFSESSLIVLDNEDRECYHTGFRSSELCDEQSLYEWLTEFPLFLANSAGIRDISDVQGVKQTEEVHYETR